MFNGDSTTDLVQDEGCNVAVFYEGVMKFCIAAIKKLLKVNDFKTNILQTLSFLNPGKCQTMHTLDLIEERIQVALDKAIVNLEHHEFTRLL